MAVAASIHLVVAMLPARTGNACRSLLSGGGSPMMPVDATKTSDALQLRSSAVCAAVSRTISRPVAPVNAFALPELTTIARTTPPLRFSRHHSTGGDAVRDVVKTPAIEEPGDTHMSMTS